MAPAYCSSSDFSNGIDAPSNGDGCVETARGTKTMTIGAMGHPGRAKPLEIGNLEHCLQLDQSCLGGIWSRSHWQTELADPHRPGMGIWLGASPNPQVLGAMASGWLVVDELHITLVAVAPQQRRRGLGCQVLGALLELGKGQGALQATLEVACGNLAAVALYRRLGFRDAGIRRGYYRNGDDALIQWVSL
ncbi:GNAT family N-acetyltransferase [Cyanobium sp. WAJ14-Wanaka]|uniref:GNAT family N-acetyltransferase n=1 Tax=Cyanobium sp. WAJ14-Wanaka TaxID=2823725 RepID=UPI0020CBB29D|nr:GNAT family N-acetyltransferase [Cyanobium sp. WAJ14-Wanaka]